MGCHLSLVISLDNLGFYLCQLSCIVFTTLFFPIGAGGQLCAGEVSEGDIKYIYVMKSMPPKKSRKYCSSRYYSLTSMCLLIILFYRSTSTFSRACNFFLISMVNEHVCMTLVSPSINFNPHSF